MIDLRALRIGVEISGKMNYYQSLEGMRIVASGTKQANAKQNTCTVVLSNLRRETRDFLLTETSPYNKNKTPKRLTVEAGRASIGLFQIFSGDIVTAEPSSPPDVNITLTAKTGATTNTTVVSRAAGARVKLSELSAQVASDIGAKLEFQATEKFVANFSYTGGALGQVNRLAEAGGVRAFLDDGTLIVQDRDKPTKGRIKVLNMNSGMVGIPKVTEQGVEVVYLVDGESVLGGTLRLQSKFNKAANGDYQINQLKFELTSHEDPFFYTALCKRL
jgi:hypothetical protein